MPADPNLSLLTKLVDKLLIFARRPDVQLQVIIIVVTFVVAGLLARSIWVWLEPRLQRWIADQTPARAQPFWQLLVATTRASTFPLLGILVMEQASVVLQAQGHLNGLLIRFTAVFATILGFQFLIRLLYAAFDETTIRRYHYRLLLPLLVVVIFLEVIDNLTNLNDLGRVVLLVMFRSPVTLGALFAATVGLYFWTDTVHVIDNLIYQLLTRFTSVDPGNAKATLTLIRYVLIIAGVAYALSLLQLDPTTLAAVTGGLSVGIGFGLREILSNFISGFLLLFERSLHPGDVVEIDGQLCVVQDLNIRTTTLRTLDNVELVIPNQTFFTSAFQTYTGSDQMVRVPMTLHTSYENDVEGVIALLRQTAEQHKDVLPEPAPSVFFNRFGDNVAEFQLNIWLNTPLKIPAVKSEVRRMVWQAFREQGIDLTFPDVALHFPQVLPALPVVSPVVESISR